MHSQIKAALLAGSFTLIFPSSVQADPKHIPSNCFELALPKQPRGSSVLGIGVSQAMNEPGKALNEVELAITRGTADNVVMSITAIRDFHLLISDVTVHKLIGLLAEVREIDRRLIRQGRDFYNEPLLDIPVIDNNGERQTLVLGVSRIPRWNCFAKGEWTSLPGAAHTFLVLRMPFALEYSRDHKFTGLQFDLEAVAKLSRTLADVLDVRPATPGTRT